MMIRQRENAGVRGCVWGEEYRVRFEDIGYDEVMKVC